MFLFFGFSKAGLSNGKQINFLSFVRESGIFWGFDNWRERRNVVKNYLEAWMLLSKCNSQLDVC